MKSHCVALVAAAALACAVCAGASSTAISFNGPIVSAETFSIHGVSFGMTKAAVTNLHSAYPAVKPPEAPLDVLSYKILSLPEEKTKIGLRRPGVIINVIKNIYFNREGKVVGIEMVFTNLDLDKRRFLLEAMDRKYEPIPDDRKNFWKYVAVGDIMLESTAIVTEPQRFEGDKVMPAMYTLKNLYFDKDNFRAALDETNKTFQLYNLL